MRRSICTSDPHVAIAGQTRTYSFSYTTANDLPKGATFTFEFQSMGRFFDWQPPQTNIKSKTNLIWLELPNKKIVQANVLQDMKTFSNSYEFKLPQDLKTGETVTIFIGSPTNDNEKANRCQLYTQRKKSFNFHIDVKSKRETEVFHLDVKGNSLQNIKIITPSLVARNKRFDVIVRFEDEFGNLTANAPEDTLIELSYEHLRENLNWKLFIPETGFITLPNLYFNEPGTYKIQLKNLKTNELFYSAPIKCFKEADYSLYWGLLHGESQKFDATDNIENCIRYYRDDKSYQFYATSSFDSEEETKTDAWKKIVTNVSEFNEDERFSVFLGFQWNGNSKEEGLRQFIYPKDNKSILRKKDLKSNSLNKIYKTLTSKDVISIPSFTMGSETVFDFKNYNEEFEKVVEIYNAWGSSEKSSKEGNTRPISGPVKEDNAGSVIKALVNGTRVGFVAGGLDDRGVYSKFYDSTQVQYSSGLTAILAKTHSRDGLFEALQKRRCYATTGKRIVVGFFIAEEMMGSELKTYNKPGLFYNRYITGFVLGTDKIKEIILYRNDQVLTKFTPDDTTFEFTYDDMTFLKEFLLKPNAEKPPFCFYYLKAIQEDGHMAWSSPIWIDEVDEAPKKIKKK
ncbi:MAG: DUF3604 domain-containing protein [Parachlamydiales bacterium]|nr:DUF3604 domain-containing protein [Parachlamydiales bacterium]